MDAGGRGGASWQQGPDGVGARWEQEPDEGRGEAKLEQGPDGEQTLGLMGVGPDGAGG